MGLFNRKQIDDGRDVGETSETQNLDAIPGTPGERPTEQMRTEPQRSRLAGWEEPARTPAAERPADPAPVAEQPAPEAPARPEPAAPAPASEPVASEHVDAEPAAPEPAAKAEPEGEPSREDWNFDVSALADDLFEGAAPAKAEQPPARAGVEKEELRRAVAGNRAAAPAPAPAEAEAEADDKRVSADDLIGPTMQRRHPFAPAIAEEPAKDKRMKVFAMANQKGGVAKTTTALNLAVALSESGHKVLCVDLDPQGNLTMSQGIDPDEVEKSLYHVLVERMPISEIIHHCEVDIAVASIDLAGAEIAMSTQIGRERALQKALAEVSDVYDFVCIDTPPSLGLLTINALTAADKVIVPVQCEYLSMRGLVQLQNTLEMIRENLNPDVQIEGILPTMLDSRTVHAKEAVEILEENFGELVFKSRIRKTIKFAEAPVKGSSVLKYDPDGNAAKSYRDLAEEVLTHGAT
jgi:chromosome partitioning protein